MNTKSISIKTKVLSFIIRTGLLPIFYVFMIGCQALTCTGSKIVGTASEIRQDYDFSKGKIYIGNRGVRRDIVMANLDGSGSVSLGSIHKLLSHPDQIEIDSDRGKIYILSAGSAVIKANLDGSGGVDTDSEHIVGENWVTADTISFGIDPASGKIYVCSSKSKRDNQGIYPDSDIDPTVIIQSDLDGGGKKFIAHDIIKKIDPKCVRIYLEAVDFKRRTLYFLSIRKGLFKANLDTSEVTRISSKLSFHFAIDSENEKIYSIYRGGDTDMPEEPSGIPATAMTSLENLRSFVNSEPEYPKFNIQRTDLDGKHLENLGDLQGLIIDPGGLAIDTVNKKMYVVDNKNSIIIRANLDGTDAENLGNLNGLVDHPMAIAVLPPCVVPKKSNNARCLDLIHK